MQLLKNIYMVSGFAYGLHPNVYIVKGKGALVMIDTGLDENDLAVIDQNLQTWGLNRYPISHCLITHAHFDHCGNARVIRQRGALTVAGPGDADGIELGDDRTIRYAYNRRFPACPIDKKVKDGDVVEAAGLKFQVIHVPGHSPGCVIYQLELKGRTILFTGDVVRVGEDCQSARLVWSGGLDYDRDSYLESLKRISTREADVILAGHFQPCLQNGYKILQNAYMRALLEWRQPATVD